MAGHTGQTLNDRLNAARYALAGQGLARVVCKATTEEVIGPKKKHLDYLLQCTHEPNVSIPQLANLLIERTNHSSWVVVFKALVTVHHLMCYGNERFTQYLASSNCTFQLSNFLDKNGVKGYEMSTFIRRYAKYLNEKALSYRTVAFDFTKIKRGKEDGSLRSMNTDKLLKTIPTLQSQVDSLLEFDCTANDLTNGVINAAFMLLFRDLIRLFACYNDGIINCLEKYFDMNKKHAREALDIYKKFLIRMDRVAEFLKVAENVGIDKGEIPDLTKAPSSLLDALEQHLSQLEGKKGQLPAKANVTTNGTTTANGSIPGDTVSNNNAGNNSTKEDPSVKKALEEEEIMLNKLKPTTNDRISPFIWKQESWLDLEKHMQEQDKKPNNPFLSMSPTTTEPKSLPSSTEKNQGILDLFNDNGNTNSSTNNTNSAQSGKASDDLLCLSNANPFADILNAASATSTSSPMQAAFPPAMAQQNMVPVLQNAPPVAPTFSNGITTHREFASDAGFAAAFGNTPNTTSSLGEDADANDKRDNTETLPVPACDEPIACSASPSPTHDILKGAGTTPILANAPDLNFGDDSGIDDNNISRGNSPLPSHIVAPPPSGENSPFGAPFEPTSLDLKYIGSAALSAKLAPARPPPPPHEMNSNTGPMRPPPPSNSALNSDVIDDNEFVHSSIEESHAPPRPPAPASQFAYFDANQQQPVYQQQQPSQPQVIAKQASASKKSFAFEDLDIAMRQTFAKPQQPIGMPTQMPPQTQQQPQQGMVYLPPGYVIMPTYGTPAQGTGFDAFGDVLQPQQLANKTGQTNQITANNATQSSTNNINNNSLSNQSLFKGDLDSSLASLAQNLDINGPKGVFKKGGQQQWSSPKNNVKTGATPQTGWSANQQPLSWNTGSMPMSAPQIMPSAGQWASTGVSPIMVSTNSMPMMQQTYGVQMRPAMVAGMAGAVPVLPGAVPVMPAATVRPINSALNSTSDPFGAL